MMQLGNCDRCGEVFAKGIREICSTCYQAEEEAFKTVYTFLTNRKNRAASMDEIVAETGIEEALIIKFLREKRLRLSQFPQLSYPCEQCEVKITEGKLCVSCMASLREALTMDADETLSEEDKAEQQSVYYTLGNQKGRYKR